MTSSQGEKGYTQEQSMRKQNRTEKCLRNYQCKCIKGQVKRKKQSCPCEVFTDCKIQDCRKHFIATQGILSSSSNALLPHPQISQSTCLHFLLNLFKCTAQPLPSPTEKFQMLFHLTLHLDSIPHREFNIWFQFQTSITLGTSSSFINAAQEMIPLSVENSFNNKREYFQYKSKLIGHF